MRSNIMKTIIVFVVLLLAGCGGLDLDTHWGGFGPSTYSLSGDGITVSYYNGQCCCIAKKVLEEVKRRVENDELDWRMMADSAYQENYLNTVCKELKARGVK